MTTAREIADWHRAEAQRLKAKLRTGGDISTDELTYRIKLHERFAAWLEKGEHDEHEKSVARHIAALELTKPPIEAIDGGRIGA